MSAIEVELPRGAVVSAKIAAGKEIAVRGGLPIGRFTPDELAQLLARLHRGVTFEGGLITVPWPGPPGRASS